MAKSIGKFIASLRKANGYTQEALADILGVSNKTISSWETDNSSPDLNMIPILADLFHVSCDEILKGERILNTSTEDGLELSLKLKKNLAKKQLLKYKNMSYISVGIFLAFLILFIPGVLFIAHVFGLVLFIISLCIYVGGIVFSMISYNICIDKIPEDENYFEYNRDILKKVTFLKCIYSFFLLSFVFCFLANRLLKNNSKYNVSTKELEHLKYNFKLKTILASIFLGIVLISFTIYTIFALTPVTYPKYSKQAAKEYLYTFTMEVQKEYLNIKLTDNNTLSIHLPSGSRKPLKETYYFPIFIGNEKDFENIQGFSYDVFSIRYYKSIGTCSICIDEFEILSLKQEVTKNGTIYFAYEKTRGIESYGNQFYNKALTPPEGTWIIYLICILLLGITFEGIYFGKRKRIL
ncbi:MAG: helix-turn-helix domain-containing protein [Anaeroplasmataceae bacterium]|nr:helix-turn-helix domain-containing protein [Anaeroplasmataceae bacterium]